ncbi:MAG TPA: (2Fe-2S)-binding protein [Pusillimonas sp.]|jgi:nicotinate dehydrogenase subunit A|nr:(2Fe-2S)-binding protein [Pusillimonas sp.]HCN71349.1 (2Fe-2S)-binding protein [Pusillimonas sp.]|tara:strand:+ start:144621 stop:145169 length:549 start_codon:yes stop_codon:yes gene_type:complete
MTKTKLTLKVNGESHDIEVPPTTPLLYILRNDLELNSPKYGCGLGECGSCTVLVDGVATRSCVMPVSGAVGRDVTTLEGLGTIDNPDPVQQAFIDKQAAQCGYCISGIVMTTRALLNRSPSPTDDEIRRELEFNLCRCGTHIEILQAVRLAADKAKYAASTGQNNSQTVSSSAGNTAVGKWP